MTGSESGTQSDDVFLVYIELILRTELKLVVRHVGCIYLLYRLGIGVGVRVCHKTGVVSPQISHIGSEREALEELVAKTYVRLVKSTLAIVAVGIGGGGRTCGLACCGIVIANISIRQDSEAQTEITCQAECRNGIFEISIIGVQLSVAFLEVCNLSGEAHIKKECQ